MAADPAVVIATARRWLGTPYHDQASLRGVGCDCLGLVRGVWRDLCGDEPETPPPYSPSWAESLRQETLALAAGRHLQPLTLTEVQLGDVLLFRWREHLPAKHCAILSDAAGAEPRIIHAYWGRAVVESWMGTWWRRRLAAVFRWPGCEN